MAATTTPQYEGWGPASEIDHVTAARTHLRSVFPEASLNPSSVEMTLIEALAVILGPVALAYQYAPAAVLEHLMGLYGLRRHQGQHAIGKARFRVTTSAPMHTIPAGTVVRYTRDDQTGTLEYVTTGALTITTSESLQGEIGIVATETGVAHNALQAGTTLAAANYLTHVQSIEVSETTHAGEGPETDASFEERATAVLARQTSALVYADQFLAAPKTREEVGRVAVINNYNAETAATAAGHITVAVTDIAGQDLTPEQRTELQEWLQGQSLASLVIHVIDPQYTTVNLSATVEAAPGSNHAEVESAVIAELTRRLNPMTWDWWTTITPMDIASWIDDVPGVFRVVDVPAGVTLTGVAPLPLPGTFTITVQEATR